ncbi:ABC transporter substrate-binding protein [Pendulispora rubella]|uniref:ABC transporter substrate-binding protein n=1 Tax=Pendulispora rubella TaxID=2741070 RepID=A0ABZ2LFJ6_9BACT
MAAGLAAAWSAVVGASGCTVIFNDDDRQCDGNASCARFPGTYCSDSNICVPTEGYCTKNVECLDRNPGKTVICRKDQNRCVELPVGACNGLIGDANDLKNDDTVILGFVDPIVDPKYTPIGLAQQNAVELALREVMKGPTSGLPPIRAGAASRPLVYVKCDENPTSLAATFNHLIDEVKVPAIIGPTFSGDVLTIANTKALPTKTLLISVSASSPLLTTLPSRDPRLVWRTVPTDYLNAKVLATFIPNYIEPELKDSSSGTVKPAGAQMKIAVVHKGDAFGTGFERAVYQQLTFNSKSAEANAQAGNYVPVNYGDPNDPNNTNPAAKYAAAVRSVVDANPPPHLVVFLATAEVNKNVFQQIEAQWKRTDYRPKYIFATAAPKTKELTDIIGANQDLRSRVIGTEAGTTSALFSQFQTLYTGQNFTTGGPPTFYTAAAYDAAYMLTYAVAAVGSNPLTGESIARGFEKLVPSGVGVDVGDTSAIPSAFHELAEGRNIDLNGATGPLNFDVSTGDAETDIQVWCVSAGSGSFASTGLFYNSNTKALSGSYSKCQ